MIARASVLLSMVKPLRLQQKSRSRLAFMAKDGLFSTVSWQIAEDVTLMIS